LIKFLGVVLEESFREVCKLAATEVEEEVVAGGDHAIGVQNSILQGALVLEDEEGLGAEVEEVDEGEVGLLEVLEVYFLELFAAQIEF